MIFFYIVSFNDNLYLLISQLDIDDISHKNQLYRDIDNDLIETLVEEYTENLESGDEDPDYPNSKKK